MMIAPLEASWEKALHNEFEADYFKDLSQFLLNAYKEEEIYPQKSLIFNAFNLCPLDQTKVVLLGQDPYHGKGQSHGLSFSVQEGVKIPPSLRNIFKELQTDLSCAAPQSGDLSAWAKQGVLLINVCLSVKAGEAASHRKKGWEQFTDAVIQLLSKEKEGIVFLLWGNDAKKKAALIDADKHLILTAAHPSPLARGAFFGSKHFSQTNAYLSSIGKTPITWELSSSSGSLF